MAPHINDNGKLDYDNLVLTALGVTVALGWNAAAKETINALYPVKQSGAAIAHIIYAIVVTLIAILLLYLYQLSKAITEKITGQNVIQNIKQNIKQNVA